MAKTNSKATGLRLPIDLMDKLDRKAQATGTTRNQLVSKAVAELFRRHKARTDDPITIMERLRKLNQEG